MDKKFKLTDETIEHKGHILHRIIALKDFSDVKKGDKGGGIEKEENLSQDGVCWVYDDAKVFDDAFVSDEAQVRGNARVFGKARVSGNAEVFGKARVFDDAEVYDKAEVAGYADIYGNAHVCGDAVVSGNALLCSGVTKSTEDYVVIGPQGSRPSYATYQIPSDTVCTGCFAGTLEEFEDTVKRVHKNNEKYLKQYKRVIDIFKIYHI